MLLACVWQESNPLNEEVRRQLGRSDLPLLWKAVWRCLFYRLRLFNEIYKGGGPNRVCRLRGALIS